MWRFGDRLDFALERRVHVGACPAIAPRLKPGTRLLPEWQGRTQEVLVGEDRFVWQQALSLAVADGPRDHRHRLVEAGPLRPETTTGPRSDHKGGNGAC